MTRQKDKSRTREQFCLIRRKNQIAQIETKGTDVAHAEGPIRAPVFPKPTPRCFLSCHRQHPLENECNGTTRFPEILSVPSTSSTISSLTLPHALAMNNGLCSVKSLAATTMSALISCATCFDIDDTRVDEHPLDEEKYEDVVVVMNKSEDKIKSPRITDVYIDKYRGSSPKPKPPILIETSDEGSETSIIEVKMHDV